MRTTIQLDDDLFREIKQEAAKKGRTLTSFIEDALRESLARRRQATARTHVELPVDRSGGGLQPGIDLNNSASLYDFMDREDVAPRR